MNCRSCDATIVDGSRFCSVCGSPVAAVDERRVVTTVFADIVGFTALAEQRDPEEVKLLVDRCFEQLAADIVSFGGVVDKVLGDAIVALFGAPTAHEDDAERAVRAALKMQESIRSFPAKMGAEQLGDAIRMRIGVNTGEVLVGTSTAGGDYTAMGDVMNSASRLEQLAEPGQVLVGLATRLATGDAIRYEPAGELAARGRAEPIEAWIAVAASGLPGAHRRGTERFVGRDRELALLQAQGRVAFELAQSQFAYVVGEPGMGKTRLVAEVADRLQNDSGATLWVGRCVPYGEANVWWSVAEMLRDAFSIKLDSSHEDAEATLAAELPRRLTDQSPATLERYRTAFLHVLGFNTSLRGGERSRNRSEVMQAFGQLLEAELAARPVVIVISDMHWAGEAVWALLQYLLTHLARSPLLVMATGRTNERKSMFDGRHGTTIVQLGPLDADSSRELLTSLVDDDGSRFSQETADALVARSGGNPFFLEELTELVKDDANSAVGRSQDTLGELPVTLRGIVAARLDALERTDRALIEDASVLGRSGSLAALRILTEQIRGSSSIDEALGRLVAKDLLAVDGPRFEFCSDLVRDVAYGTLTKKARAERHRDIARFLERTPEGSLRGSTVAAIADHYRSAARLSSELVVMSDDERIELVSKAQHWILEAGSRSMAVGEPAVAERWFSFGLDLTKDEQTRSDFLFGRARARSETHDIAGARSDLRKLEDHLEHDPLMAAKALLVTGDVSRKAGDVDEAASELREAADRLASLGAVDQQALALRLLGLTEMARSDDSLAHQAFEASRQVAAQAGDRRSEAWTIQSMAWLAFSQGRVNDANRLAATAIEVFVELGDRNGLGWAQGVQAWVAFHLGQLGTAQELVDSLLPDTRRRGDPWAESILLTLAASLELWTGKAASALTLCREAQEVGGRSDDLTLIAQSMAVEGRALVSLGRVVDGATALERSFATADRQGDRYNRRTAVIANCASAARIGESSRALRWASHFEGLHGDPDVVGEADLVISVALALLQRGSVAEAASQLAWAHRPDTSPSDYYGAAVRTVVAAVEGRIDDVATETARIVDGGGTYLDKTMALLALASSRVQVGDVDGCDAALARARSVVSTTDDRMSRWTIDLVAAICGRGDLTLAETQMAKAGLDPAGLVNMWHLAAHRRIRA